jgi:glyoxylase-like metal-dependent hydrolase (beta-lactamase superfamily II)
MVYEIGGVVFTGDTLFAPDKGTAQRITFTSTTPSVKRSWSL